MEVYVNKTDKTLKIIHKKKIKDNYVYIKVETAADTLTDLIDDTQLLLNEAVFELEGLIEDFKEELTEFINES
jgi:hypothetical protein